MSDSSSYISRKLSVIEFFFYNDIRVEVHSDAPRGFLTQAIETTIPRYDNPVSHNELLYLIHPDDLEAMSKHYPKQIPIQIED